MTLKLICNVCDSQFDVDERQFWASVDMPAVWTVSDLDEPDERLVVDVCSPKCMFDLGNVFQPEVEEEEFVEPTPKRNGSLRPTGDDVPRETHPYPDVTVR